MDDEYANELLDYDFFESYIDNVISENQWKKTADTKAIVILNVKAYQLTLVLLVVVMDLNGMSDES